MRWEGQRGCEIDGCLPPPPSRFGECWTHILLVHHVGKPCRLRPQPPHDLPSPRTLHLAVPGEFKIHRHLAVHRAPAAAGGGRRARAAALGAGSGPHRFDSGDARRRGAHVDGLHLGRRAGEADTGKQQLESHDFGGARRSRGGAAHLLPRLPRPLLLLLGLAALALLPLLCHCSATALLLLRNRTSTREWRSQRGRQKCEPLSSACSCPAAAGCSAAGDRTRGDGGRRDEW